MNRISCWSFGKGRQLSFILSAEAGREIVQMLLLSLWTRDDSLPSISSLGFGKINDVTPATAKADGQAKALQRWPPSSFSVIFLLSSECRPDSSPSSSYVPSSDSSQVVAPSSGGPSKDSRRYVRSCCLPARLDS
jgi:hypothetical protein